MLVVDGSNIWNLLADGIEIETSILCSLNFLVNIELDCIHGHAFIGRLQDASNAATNLDCIKAISCKIYHIHVSQLPKGNRSDKSHRSVGR